MKDNFTLRDARRVATMKRCGMKYYSFVLTTGMTMTKFAKGRNPYGVELMDTMVSDFKMRRGLNGEEGNEPHEAGLTTIDHNRDHNLRARNPGCGTGNSGRSCWKCGSNDHIRANCHLLNFKYPGCHSKKGHLTKNCF